MASSVVSARQYSNISYARIWGRDLRLSRKELSGGKLHHWVVLGTVKDEGTEAFEKKHSKQADYSSLLLYISTWVSFHIARRIPLLLLCFSCLKHLLLCLESANQWLDCRPNRHHSSVIWMRFNLESGARITNQDIYLLFSLLLWTSTTTFRTASDLLTSVGLTRTYQNVCATSLCPIDHAIKLPLPAPIFFTINICCSSLSAFLSNFLLCSASAIVLEA